MSIDYIEEQKDVRETLSLSERELKNGNVAFQFSLSLSVVNEEGESKVFDTKQVDNAVTFYQNYKYWEQETKMLSVNNLDNSYFRGIVDMGVDAVPYILDELKKGPSQLVNALDLIFPGVMQYEGFVSLKDACDKWLSILK
mgnify:CR=1 FL=1